MPMPMASSSDHWNDKRGVEVSDIDGRSTTSHEIPIIDLNNPNQSQLIDEVYHACSTWGFFQLVNHGIPDHLLSSFRSVTRDFFALPHDIKLRLKRHAGNARGYFDDELTKRKRDWKEAIDIGVPGGRDWNLPDDDVQNACLDGYNQFPTGDDCPNFRNVIVEYFNACSMLSGQLARLMTIALCNKQMNDEEIEMFLKRLEMEHTSYLRINYYPPCAIAEDRQCNSIDDNTFYDCPLGISPHRDAGFLTILLQDDDCHSLQVARFEDDDDVDEDNNKWVTVHPVPGSLTINTGDMAMICSNGRFRAPLHRVLTDPEKRRYSAPFFYNPGYIEYISPFGCCSKQEVLATKSEDYTSCKSQSSNIHAVQTVKYHPCLWGYFRALRFAGDLTDLGVEIQTSHYRIVESKTSSHIETQEKFMKLVDFNESFNVDKYRHILISGSENP